MKKTLLLATALLFFSNSATENNAGKTRIKDFVESYAEALKLYGSYAASPSLDKARKFSKWIRRGMNSQPSLNEMVAALEEEDFIEDYLALWLIENDILLDTFLLSRDVDKTTHGPDGRRYWHKVNELSYLKGKINELRKIQSRKHLEETIRGNFRNLSERTLKEIQLYPFSGQQFDEKVWPVFSDKLNGAIEAGEAFIWRTMAPDTTIKQLEHFINFASSGMEGFDGALIYNQNAEIAFELFYEASTVDGEPATLRYFENLMRERANTIWPVLFNRITSRFMEDLTAANWAANIVNTDDLISLEAYESVIKAMAPKEIAYQALVKAMQLTWEIDGLDAALDRVDDYRQYFHGYRYTRTLEKLEILINLLRRVKEEGQYDVILMEEWNTPGDEIEYVFNAKLEYALVIPFNQGEEIRKFQKSQDEWIEIPSSLRYQEHNFYEFEPRMASRLDQEQAHSKNLRFKGNQLKAKLVRDFFIDHNRGVAFFVSDSRLLRRTPPREENTPETREYESPGLIPLNHYAAFEENKSYDGFHGKGHANPNTDIYYSIRKGDHWTAPMLFTVPEGPGINTPYSERSPSISQDGTKLYFSSEGHAGLGGFDVFEVPVTIIPGSGIKATGAVRNLYGYNTVHDDLFFRDLPIGKFISSDRFSRGQQFDIGKFSGQRTGMLVTNNSNGLTRKEDPRPEPQAEPGYNEVGNFIDEEDREKTFITFYCDTLSERRRAPKGHIFVTGRIFRPDSSLVERGSIIFTSKQGIEKSDTVNLGVSADSTYTVLIPDNRAYLVQAYEYAENGDTIESWMDDFIFVCENIRQERVVKFDAVVRSMSDLGRNSYITRVPFFFETDRWDPSAINNLEYIREYYLSFIERFGPKSKWRFIINGYADVRGGHDYNCCLSMRRAESVRRFLIQNGFPAERLVVVPHGRTTKYTKSDIDKIEQYVDFRGNSLQWSLQMNRRVEVIFSSSEGELPKSPCTEKDLNCDWP